MLSPNLLKAYTNVMIAVEAAKHGVTGGGDTVSGLMFADDFVGISETPEALQKQIEKALEESDSERKKVCSSCM